MNTLNEKGVELTHLLTTDAQAKLSGISLPRREETVRVLENV